MKIYIVRTGYNYEGYDNLRAFADKDQAEAFATECEKWVDAPHTHESGYFAFCAQFGEMKYIGDYIDVEELDLIGPLQKERS